MIRLHSVNWVRDAPVKETMKGRLSTSQRQLNWDIIAHYQLSVMYHEGEGVERDLKKGTYHMEEAAIGGHPNARHYLGCEEMCNGRIDRAYKHFIIAANLGDDGALEAVKQSFAQGFVSKEDYEAALRGHQAAVDATKSKQREEAYAFDKKKQAFLSRDE